MWCRSQVSSVAITPKPLLRNQFAYSAVSLLCSSEIAISLSISILVMFDAGGFAIKNLLTTRQNKRNPQPSSERHKGVTLAINQHVPGALHVRFL